MEQIPANNKLARSCNDVGLMAKIPPASGHPVHRV